MNAPIRAEFCRLCCLIVWLVPLMATAELVRWSNPTGGSWHVASSWDPPRVPGVGDAVEISGEEPSEVTIEEDAEVESISIGGGLAMTSLNLRSGTLRVAGRVTSLAEAKLVISGGRITGRDLLLEGPVEWRGGDLGEMGGHVTVGAEGVLHLMGETREHRQVYAKLINAGTINLLGPGLVLTGDSSRLVNLASGVIESPMDGGIHDFETDGATFENHGTIRKSGVSGVFTFGRGLHLANHGLLEVLSGKVVLQGGGGGSGVFRTEPRTTLEFDSSFAMGEKGMITGSGTNRIKNGPFTVEGAYILSNIWLSGSARLIGTNLTLAGTVRSEGAAFGDANSRTTLAEGSELICRAGAYFQIQGAFINAGTIILSNAVSFGGPGARLVNLKGGLVDLNESIGPITDRTPGQLIENHGTFRLSIKSGTVRIPMGLPFVNHGTLEALGGTVMFQGGGKAAGVFMAGPGATIDFASNYVLEEAGRMVGLGTNRISLREFRVEGFGVVSNITLSGTARLVGTNVTLAGTVNWENGSLSDPSSQFTVAPGAVLNIHRATAPLHTLDYSLTNAGTINFMGSWLRLHGPSARLVNLPGGVMDFKVDGKIEPAISLATPFPVVENYGVMRKSGGGGRTTIANGLEFRNKGTLEALTGTLALEQGYTQEQARLVIGIRGPADHGKFTFLLGGPPTETIAAELLDGYRPAASTAFAVMVRGGSVDGYKFDLPDQFAWQTSMAQHTLTLTVLNGRPIMPPTPDLVVEEETPLSLSLTAADLDAGQGVTHALLDPPAGVALDPATGRFTWTPTEAQGPGVYQLAVVATDTGEPPMSSTNHFQVAVLEVNQPPVVEQLADLRATAGTTVAAAIRARDFDLPAQPVSLRLGSGPVGATLDDAGNFRWRIGAGQAGATHFVRILANDGSTEEESAMEFSAVVDPLPEFILSSTGFGPGGLSLTMNALPGLDYVLQRTIDFTSWLDVATNSPPGASVGFTVPATPEVVELYRVRVQP